MWARVGEVGVQRLPPAVPEPEPIPEQAPEAVLDFLRLLGVAMCRAGDAADRVTLILEDVATAYSAHGVSFFVLPTGVFVRIDTGSSSRVDFAPGSNRPLRLDQVDELYRLIDDIRLGKVEVQRRHRPARRASSRTAAVRCGRAGARNRRPHGRPRADAQPDRDGAAGLPRAGRGRRRARAVGRTRARAVPDPAGGRGLRDHLGGVRARRLAPRRVAARHRDPVPRHDAARRCPHDGDRRAGGRLDDLGLRAPGLRARAAAAADLRHRHGRRAGRPPAAVRPGHRDSRAVGALGRRAGVRSRPLLRTRRHPGAPCSGCCSSCTSRTAPRRARAWSWDRSAPASSPVPSCSRWRTPSRPGGAARRCR